MRPGEGGIAGNAAKFVGGNMGQGRATGRNKERPDGGTKSVAEMGTPKKGQGLLLLGRHETLRSHGLRLGEGGLSRVKIVG